MNIIKFSILFFLISAPLSSIGACWKLNNITGYEAFKSDGYKFEKGEFGIELTLIINNNSASVSANGQDSSLKYIPISPTMIIGVYSEGGISTSETFSINGNRVLYAKIVNDNRKNIDMTGAHSMVGDATPCSS
ncbi:hypothetical protein AB6866_04305 [Rahnella inusitata]|uniref:hypothetical protein n=1 Tax=Rahnella inusitata TaxID=58169 RepID=UPI0039BDB811